MYNELTGLWESIVNRATVIHAMEAWRKSVLNYDLPDIDLSKERDCDDPDQTSGGDDCGDIGGKKVV